MYHSPYQNHEEFENFCINFVLLLSNINNKLPICSIFPRQFNNCSSNWWENDITNSVGQELDSITSSAGYSQIVDKPTQIVNNSISCINLIFRTNANVISKHRVYVSILKMPSKYYFCKTDICVTFPNSLCPQSAGLLKDKC